MTCQQCTNYEECKDNNKLKFEIYDDGWVDEPRLCNYVQTICRRFDAKVESRDCSTCGNYHCRYPSAKKKAILKAYRQRCISNNRHHYHPCKERGNT